MRKVINKALEHPLISGSALIFVGMLLSNVTNFFFNIFMSRTLSLPDYGTLMSLISVISLFAFTASAVVPTVVHFGGIYFAKDDLAMVRGFFIKISKILLITGFIIFALFVLFRHDIGAFFKINSDTLIMLAGLNIFIGFIGIINQAFLQAKLDFSFLSLFIFIGTFFKFVLGAGLVLIGFAVNGAMWAFLAAGLVPYVLGFSRLPFLFNKEIKKTHISFKTLFTYGGPAMLAIFGLTSFISTDIILVKHFFDPKEAGIYATLSLVGRAIYFFSAPVGTVMFPLIVQKHAKKENYHNIFRLSLLIVFLASIVITIFYFSFPNLVLRIFSGKEDAASAASLVGLFGAFTSLYSLLTIVTNFYLSIKKIKVFIPIILGALLQASLIWFFHKDFLQITLISLVTTSLLLLSLLVYYLKHYKDESS